MAVVRIASTEPASPWGGLARVVGWLAAAAAVGTLLGWGVAASAARALGPIGGAGPLGAVVGAVVALCVVPLVLWARVPDALSAQGRARRASVRRLTARRGDAAAGDHTSLPSTQPMATADDWRGGETAPPASDVAGMLPKMPDPSPALSGFGALVSAPRNVATASLSERSAASASAAAQGLDGAAAVRDPLTGAYSQQHFIAAADREWARVRRLGEDAALLMVDVDHFAQVNAQHGAPCGDLVLIEVTRQVAGTLRQYDLLSRFSGGVLMVYLPHTDPLGALDVAERIRECVAGWRMQHDGRAVRVTVSIGVAAIGASHARLDEAIADVGAALREAKEAGRNCVRAAPIPPKQSRPRVPTRD